jgi:hypothetical protein
MSLTKDMIRQVIEEEKGTALKAGDLVYKEGSKGMIMTPPNVGDPNARILWLTGPRTSTISWEYVSGLARQGLL